MPNIGVYQNYSDAKSAAKGKGLGGTQRGFDTHEEECDHVRGHHPWFVPPTTQTIMSSRFSSQGGGRQLRCWDNAFFSPHCHLLVMMPRVDPCPPPPRNPWAGPTLPTKYLPLGGAHAVLPIAFPCRPGRQRTQSSISPNLCPLNYYQVRGRTSRMVSSQQTPFSACRNLNAIMKLEAPCAPNIMDLRQVHRIALTTMRAQPAPRATAHARFRRTPQSVSQANCTILKLGFETTPRRHHLGSTVNILEFPTP